MVCEAGREEREVGDVGVCRIKDAALSWINSIDDNELGNKHKKLAKKLFK